MGKRCWRGKTCMKEMLERKDLCERDAGEMMERKTEESIFLTTPKSVDSFISL